MDNDSRDIRDAVKIIPAKIKGGYVPILVDDEDYDRLSGFTWGIIAGGYPARQVYSHSIKKPGAKRSQSYYKKIYMHREIMDAQPGELVDHVNHNIRDNRRENLRLCTHSQNSMNRIVERRGSSRFKGVRKAHPSTRMANKTWIAEIVANGKRTHLGYFATEEEAAAAYDLAALADHGNFALTNGLGL